MKGEDAEALPVSGVFQVEILADSGFLGDGKKVAERIDHHITDQINGLAGTAFFEEMLYGVLFGDEEKIGKGVGEDAIDFLGHGTIKAAKSGLDVGYWNTEFYGG